jgi:hypothetical protein
MMPGGKTMNALERLLQDDLDRLVDRLAITTRAGALGHSAERHPELRSRLETAERRICGLRDELLQRYADWRGALEECADVWAVASLAAEATVDAPRRAA